jgi:hypothetical protein
MTIAAALWAALCVTLAADGHAPSVAVIPIAREHYYLAQAAFVLPLLLALWLVCARAALAVATALGGAGRWTTTASPMGFALAIPLVFFFLLPDFVVYAASGFGALGALLRVTAPLSFAATLLLATQAISVSHGLSSRRAVVAASAGVVLQAALGGVFLR